MTDTVLIVDDDASVQTMLYKIIKSNGINADTASSGETALEMIKKNTYDVILLDINMNGMDGFQVITTLRNNGIKTPIIVVSGRKVDVVINASSLTDPERAQIEDIVKRKAEVTAENIVITLMKLQE